MYIQPQKNRVYTTQKRFILMRFSEGVARQTYGRLRQLLHRDS